MVEIPTGISKKRFKIIAMPENPVIGNPADRAKLWTATAIKILPALSKRRSVAICFFVSYGGSPIGFVV